MRPTARSASIRGNGSSRARGRLPGLVRAHARSAPHAAARPAHAHLRALGLRKSCELLHGRQPPIPIAACLSASRRGGGSTIDASECAELGDPKRTLLGIEQEQWLQAGLESSRQRWNVIGQQTLMAQFNRAEAGGKLWTDGWDGYPLARRRLLEQLTKTSNPVVIGGDVHAFFVSELKMDLTTRARRSWRANLSARRSARSTADSNRWTSVDRRTRTYSSPRPAIAATRGSTSRRSVCRSTCARWKACRRAKRLAARSPPSWSKTENPARFGPKTYLQRILPSE